MGKKVGGKPTQYFFSILNKKQKQIKCVIKQTQ